MTMTKHEHDDNCPWCQERAERKHDKGRMDAMAKAFLELNDCNLDRSTTSMIALGRSWINSILMQSTASMF